MTGAFAGGCRSLYEVVRAVPKGEVECVFVAPRGSIHDFFSSVGEVDRDARDQSVRQHPVRLLSRIALVGVDA